MDISKITDVNQLKALAYDEVCAIESAQVKINQHRENISVINGRINEMTAESQKTDAPTPPNGGDDNTAPEPEA